MKLNELIERVLNPRPDARLSADDAEAMMGAIRLLLVEVESLRTVRDDVRLLKVRLDGMESVLRERSRAF